MKVLESVIDNATEIPREDMNNVANLKSFKEIYSCWESNDYGEDFTLYTGYDTDGVTPRYFVYHFVRDWFGGWSYDETRRWYEISEKDYLMLSEIEIKP